MELLQSPTIAIDLANLANPLFLFSPPNQDLLRRCASVRICDYKVFDQVLRIGLADVMPFQELETLFFVERLPGTEYRCQLRNSARTQIFNTWWSTDGQTSGEESEILPTGLKQLSESLVAFYKSEGDALEQLSHLAVVDQTEAIKLLDELYDEADKQFDLPQCSAILRTLEERPQKLLGPKLLQAMARKRLRLDTRSMWAQEFRATIPYVERNETQDLLNALLADPQHWILNIHAPGGMGKSMYIRAVIARRCVLENIPCAKIDFDFVPHLIPVASEPWRLLLRIAQQLTRQLPRNPFQELLTAYGKYMAEADNSTIISPREFVGAELPDVERKSLRADVLSRFTETLREVSLPVVLILDTLENLLHGNVDLEEVYNLLEEVHTRCAKVRVILAGRLDLAQPLPQANGLAGTQQDTEFSRRFAGQNIAVNLRGFDEDEAHTYLEQKRGLVDDARVPVMIELARIQDGDHGREGISPFKLALLADIVRVNPKITAEEFERYEDIDLAYLIERVVDRIHDDQVKWLVRYGVVPRLLTRAIVKDVMIPFMLKGMQGQAEEDDANQDSIVEPQLAELPFPVSTKGPVDVNPDALWNTLYRYTAEYSWVLADEESDALRLHQDVIEPMRRLLRKHLAAGRRILPELHVACARYYEEVRAKADPGNRARWLGEAVYHRLQSGDSNADAYWLRLVNEAGDDDETVVALSDEAVREPLIFDETSRQVSQEMLRFGEAVRARAHFELARRKVKDIEIPTKDDWAFVDRHVAAAEELSTATGETVPTGELAYLRGRSALAQHHPQQALEVCQQALKNPADPLNELELQTLVAESLRSLGQSSAIDQFAVAAALAQKLQLHRLDKIAPGWIAALDAEERYEEAADVCARWRDEIGSTGAVDTMGESLLAHMRQYLAMGQERRAAMLTQNGLDSWLTASTGQLGALGSWPARLQAEILLAQQQPAMALRQLEREIGPALKGKSGRVWQPFETDLRARSYADLVDVLRAKPEMETLALSIHGPQTEQGVRWLLEYARLNVDETGNLREASGFLKSAQENAQDATSAGRCELLRVRLLARKGQQAEARDAAKALTARPDLPKLPSFRLLVNLEHVIQSGDVESWQSLIDAAQAIAPTSRRLLLLAELRRCPKLEAISGEAKRALVALLPDPTSEDLDPALGALRLAEVFRAVGQEDDARRLLQQADAASRKPLRLAVLRQVYLANDRLGWEDDSLKAVSLDELLVPSSNESPELSGLTILEHAERVALVLSDYQWAARLLEQAEGLLKPSARVWAARTVALRARIAWLQGDDKILEYRDLATKNFLTVDDTVSAELLNKNLSASAEAYPASALSQPPSELSPHLDVHLSLVGRDWRVELVHSDGRYWAADVPLEADFATLFDYSSREAISRKFVEAFQDDWQKLTLQMGRHLFPEDARALITGGDRPLAVRLDVRSTSLQWLPWELLRLDNDSPPLAISDGCKAFYRHVARTRLTGPGDSQAGRVLVVHMAGEDNLIGTRSAYTGTSLTKVYRHEGVPVDELVQPSMEQIADALLRLRPSVVHLVSNLVESGPQVALVFGSRRDAILGDSVSQSSYSPSMTQTVSASQLGALMASLEPAPLVVLDVPAPPALNERLRQLFLRNAFTADWASYAPPAAILGTGLVEGEQQVDPIYLLLRLLRRELAIGDIAREIRIQASTGYVGSTGFSPSLVPFGGTALFTDRPEQVFPL